MPLRQQLRLPTTSTRRCRSRFASLHHGARCGRPPVLTVFNDTHRRLSFFFWFSRQCWPSAAAESPPGCGLVRVPLPYCTSKFQPVNDITCCFHRLSDSFTLALHCSGARPAPSPPYLSCGFSLSRHSNSVFLFRLLLRCIALARAPRAVSSLFVLRF